MARAFAYSIPVVLVIAVITTMAFPPNIHEKMTRDERFAVFGSEDSVPEYQIFPMSLSGTRRRREAGADIKLKVEIGGKEIDLDLEPTTGYLVTKYTPVWSANTDVDAWKNIRYDPLPMAMSDIGEFKMYHDVKNEAAITVYNDPEEEIVIEGVITSDYAIRSLPKRLMEERLQGGDYLVETPLIEKRSVVCGAEKDTRYFAVFKTPAVPKDANRSIPVDLHNLHREKRARRTRPEAVYPEILIVLDHNAIRDHTITQALRFICAFWNAVDLVYSTLDKPKVHLNIAGIIIAADDSATPYIAETTSIAAVPKADDILSKMGTYFYNDQVRFPLEHYDMIIGMTTLKLCLEETDPCEIVLGYAHLNAACSSEREISRMKTIMSTGIFYYNWKFGGVDTAIHEAAHLFGVEHDEGYGMTAECDNEEGHVMAASAQYAHQSFKWSNCSRHFFTRYFSSKASECLDNEPLWTKPVDEVLPGRWLTMDGQCRNDGFKNACKVAKIPICMAKGCQAEGSDDCVINQWTPLPGSKCGTNKYCNRMSTCVPE